MAAQIEILLWNFYSTTVLLPAKRGVVSAMIDSTILVKPMEKDIDLKFNSLLAIFLLGLANERRTRQVVQLERCRKM